MEIIRILGHRTPKFFRNAEDSVPYSGFQQSDKLKFDRLGTFACHGKGHKFLTQKSAK